MPRTPLQPLTLASPQGAYPGIGATPPLVPGYEGLGEVVSGPAGWEPGTKVHALFDSSRAGQGSWQQYAPAAPERVTRVPPGLRDEVAAQMRGNPATAWGMLQQLAPPAGEYVLQSAAGSTLGRMFIQLAKKSGVRTINVIRTRDKRERQLAELQQLGGDAILAADADDIAARVMELTGGRGAWGAVDAVAGDMTGRLAEAVRPGGTVLVYGALSAKTRTLNVTDLLGRDVAVRGFMLVRWLDGLSAEARDAALAQLDAWLADGSVVPAVAATAKLEDAQQALAAVLRPGRSGKVLLVG
jgi:NADPH:quinone reductase-like Zn-dependent oxidoreductase